MKTVTCPACKSVNGADEATCARCGESLAAAKLEQSIAELRALNERTQHLRRPASSFNSINGFGTTLLDYRPRGDGTWEAVRWVIVMSIPLVPLGAYVIEPHRQEHAYGRQTSTFSVVDRVPLTAQRIVRTYLLVVIGLLPLALGFGAGAELQRPLALAVIGGLSVSTFVTLYLVPVAYRALRRE